MTHDTKLLIQGIGVIVATVFGCIYFGYILATYAVHTKPILMPDKDVVFQHYLLNYTKRNSHGLAAELYGGLGNRMFQYAALYGMALNNYMIPMIDKDEYILSIFPNLLAQRSYLAYKWKSWPKYHERACCIFEYNSFTLNFEKDIFMNGFFQSWRYFDNHRRSIKEQFKFHHDIQKHTDNNIQKITSQFRQYTKIASNATIEYVGIHVRRGDFLLPHNMKKGYSIADEDYISKAIHYFGELFENVIFIVVSEDMKWCEENLSFLSKSLYFSKFSIGSPQSVELDMCTLASCNHTIITSGTFGWWGAYLAGGKAIYYKDFPEPGSKLSRQFAATDYYDFRWIPLK